MVTLSCSYASKIEQAIIAAAVCSRTGQIQCARTYLPIAFGRLEALVTSFPRQLEAGQQHRYVERRGTAVRFVFQSLDDYYVVILTNRSSNVIADLQAVAQFSAATADVAGRCQAPDGKIQLDQGACYDLLLAFDEIVSELGIAAISRDALHEALAMESHEEAVQEAILQVHFFIPDIDTLCRQKPRRQRRLQSRRSSNWRWQKRKLCGRPSAPVPDQQPPPQRLRQIIGLHPSFPPLTCRKSGRLQSKAGLPLLPRRRQKFAP